MQGIQITSCVLGTLNTVVELLDSFSDISIEFFLFMLARLKFPSAHPYYNTVSLEVSTNIYGRIYRINGEKDYQFC